MHENHASIVALHRLKTFFKKSADTFASTQYFQIYLKRFGDLVVDDFYRKFQMLSLANKNNINQRNKREGISKVLRSQLLLGHPLH